jgi:hypothetical protein
MGFRRRRGIWLAERYLQMFNDDELFPTRYYNNATFPVPSGRVIAIHKAWVEQVKDPQTGVLRPKVMVSFVGLDKPFPLNRTNYTALAEVLGRDGAAWAGANVQVHRVPVSMNGKSSLSVRFVPLERDEAGTPSTAATSRPPAEDVPF